MATYSEQTIIAILQDAGFSPRRLPYNLEHNPRRMTFICTRRHIGQDDGNFRRE
jgi:hypothetical protein